MKIQYVSDLHLEFADNWAFLKKYPLEPKGDILLLGGDILLFREMDKYRDFFSYLSDHFPITYWLPGNHEYYHFDVSEKCGKIHESIRENVFLVNDCTISYEDFRMIFSTLWTNISPRYKKEVENGLTDFRVVKYKGNRFSVADFNLLHSQSLSFLKEEISQEFPGKTLISTHHVPTFRHYPPRYRGSLLNEGFAVELEDLILDQGPDYWLFGHHHYNCPDFKIGKTKLGTNQLGYVHRKENKGFDRGKLFVI